MAVEVAVWGNSVLSWCERVCAVWEPPRPPAWQREERVQWAAECLGTCYNTLPAHTAEALGLIEKYSWWWDLKKLKLVCPAPVAPVILLIFVCVTACLIDLLSPWLVLVHWPKQWSCLLCFQEFLKVLAEQNEQNTAFHSCPDWTSQQLLIPLSIHSHPVVSLKKTTKLKGKWNWKKN